MEEQFDRMRALGEIPSTHAERFKFLADADRSVIATIGCGVLFVMAFWSGPSRKAFMELKRALGITDPNGQLELVVVDTDGCPDLYQLPEFVGKLHGNGETAWIRNGQILWMSGIGFHPECFEPLTRQLLKERTTQV